MFFVLIFIRLCVRIITGKGALILQNRSAFFILYFLTMASQNRLSAALCFFEREMVNIMTKKILYSIKSP